MSVVPPLRSLWPKQLAENLLNLRFPTMRKQSAVCAGMLAHSGNIQNAP